MTRKLTGVLIALAVTAACTGENAKRGSEAMSEGPPPVTGDTITTSSGLRYIVIDEGDGPVPTAGQRVSVHYTGWLTNGRKFDSSRDRGQPFSFTLGAGQVIRGWDEGVALMHVGGVRRLILPPDLAYGDRGAGNVIPPGATLIFDVELLGIQQ